MSLLSTGNRKWMLSQPSLVKVLCIVCLSRPAYHFLFMQIKTVGHGLGFCLMNAQNKASYSLLLEFLRLLASLKWELITTSLQTTRVNTQWKYHHDRQTFLMYNEQNLLASKRPDEWHVNDVSVSHELGYYVLPAKCELSRFL